MAMTASRSRGQSWIPIYILIPGHSAVFTTRPRRSGIGLHGASNAGESSRSVSPRLRSHILGGLTRELQPTGRVGAGDPLNITTCILLLSLAATTASCQRGRGPDAGAASTPRQPASPLAGTWSLRAIEI